MLSPTKRVMEKYKTLLMKMALDMNVNFQAATNFEHLVDLEVLLSLLLEHVHNLIKFFQHNNIFVCDFVSAGKIC
jgi:hypothetical protein